MKRSTKIRLWAFGGALALVGAGLWLDARLALDQSAARLEYVYQRALGDLTDHVTSMGRTLRKARYAGTAAMRSSLSAQILEESGGAKAAMASLPFSQEKTERISRFLSQTGDYALALSRKSLSGQQAKEEDLKGLKSLEEYAGKLAEALSDIQARLTAQKASIHRLESLLNNVDEIESLALLDDDLDQVAKEFAQFPALLYDGPFSDHIPQRAPRFLRDAREITQEEAAGRAGAFLGCPSKELAYSGKGGSQLAVYAFTHGDAQVHVTVQGGEIAYYKKESHSDPVLSYGEALEKAKQSLKKLGLPDLQESYYVMNDGLCTINFHTTAQAGEERALCYPDLIKAVIELGQGGMVEYDCTGYLMNHQERRLASPELTAEEAQKLISPLLRVERARLAVIPTPGLDEVLCWEFLCTAEDSAQILSYINASTGLEEQLFLLQSDDHGVLAF